MNNLYSWPMSGYLPYDGFQWLKNEFDVIPVSEKCEIGYYLDVELEYLHKLPELHNDYSLGPKKLAGSSDMMSKYCKQFADKYEIKVMMEKN